MRLTPSRLLLLLVATTVIRCSSAPVPSVSLRFDLPQEAYDFERAQRLGWAADTDPRAKYREAIAWEQQDEAYSAGSHSASPWHELGPGNIGGRTRTLVIDPSNPQRMLLGGVSGGIWRSDDGGSNWRATGDSLTNLAINSMAIDPANPSVVYVGTGEGYFREEVRGTDLPLRGGGIYVSHDFGETWSYLESTGSPDFYFVNDIEVSSGDSQRLYAATRSGVWRSLDNGVTWSRVLASDAKGGCLDLALDRSAIGDRLFASCGTLGPSTVYRNEKAADDAMNWDDVLSEEGMGRTSLAIAPSSPNVVYALATRNAPGDEERDQALFAVFRSDNGGAGGSWNIVARGDAADVQSLLLSSGSLIPTCESGAKPRHYVNMGWYTNTIAVDPVNPMRVWAGGVDLFRSDDGGITWGLAGGDVHVDQHMLVFSPRYDGAGDRTLYAMNDGGIWRTDDATAPVATLAQLCANTAPHIDWTSMNHSLGITQLYHGVLTADGSVIAGSQDNGFVRSGANGANDWTMIAGGDGGYSAVDPTNARVIYAMTAFGMLLQSTNGGLRFTPAGSPRDDGFLFVTPMILDARPAATIWVAGSRVWRSTNGASSWTAATNVLPDGVASALAVSPVDPDRLFVGTSSGAIYRGTSARSAVDATWEHTVPRRGFVSSIVAASNESLYATYAGFGAAHVWRSRDGGRQWTDIDGVGDRRLPDLPVHAIVVDSSTGALYIATDIGVYSSADDGASWSRTGTGLPHVVTKWLEIRTVDGRRELVAFTHGRGAWSMDLQHTRKRGIRR